MCLLVFLGVIGPWQLLILCLLLLLLFGGRWSRRLFAAISEGLRGFKRSLRDTKYYNFDDKVDDQ